MGKSGNALVALVAGAAVGAVAALLYAPDSGEKTRRKLSDQAKKTQADIEKTTRETYNNLTSKATELKGSISERIDTALSSASVKADDAIVALEEKLEQLRSKNSKMKNNTSSVQETIKNVMSK